MQGNESTMKNIITAINENKKDKPRQRERETRRMKKNIGSYTHINTHPARKYHTVQRNRGEKKTIDYNKSNQTNSHCACTCDKIDGLQSVSSWYYQLDCGKKSKKYQINMKKSGKIERARERENKWIEYFKKQQQQQQQPHNNGNILNENGQK